MDAGVVKSTPVKSDSLIASFSFDGNANDSSGNSLNGTVTGATLTTDKDGNANSAYAFDGNDYIDLPGSEDDFSFVQNTGVFTISAFIKLDDVNARGVIVSSGGSTIHKAFTFMYETFGPPFGNHQLRFFMVKGVNGQAFDILGSEYTINDNNWHHVMVVGDGVNATIYVDGVQDGASAPISLFSTGTSTYPLRVGGSYDQTGNLLAGLQGSLDEIQIFDRAVSPSEIQSLASGKRPGEELVRKEVPSGVNRYKFQGQEHQDDLDLGWVQFKYRMHDPAIGRFMVVDPLADDYEYNSPYAFSENQVTAHVELEGLEKITAVTIGSDVQYRGDRIGNSVPGSAHTNIRSDESAKSQLLTTLKSESASDPKGIGFLGIFSHGIPDQIFGKGGFENGVATSDLEDIGNVVESGEVTFAEGAIIYLGGCNAGTCGFETDENGNAISFAQEFADVTGATVVAAENDQVGPKDESNGNLIYTTAFPRENEFKSFERGKTPVGLGSTIDVNKLIDASKQRTSEQIQPLEPRKPNEL